VTHTILHVIPSLVRSGIVTQLLQLADDLPRDEFAHEVVALDDHDDRCASYQDFQRQGIQPFALGRRAALDPLAIWRLSRKVSRSKPSIVHTWSPPVHRIAGRTLFTGAAALVTSVRKLNARGRRPLNLFDRSLLKRTARIVVNSNTVQSECVARGMDVRKLTLIEGAVSVTPEALHNPSREITRELNTPADAKLIACIGSLTVEKRLKELIWATDQLQAVGMVAHLLLIGVGPLRPQLERYARLNHVHGRVHFLGSRADVDDILNQCDVLWLAAANVGQSFAVLEAMAAGLPVVAADGGGNRELVIPGETGFLVPLKERAGFARSTLPLLENPEQARQFGAAGRRRLLANHGVDRMISQYTEMYRGVLEKSV
jgi:glycosyltransferase involved in cell wall biosynthesis